MWAIIFSHEFPKLTSGAEDKMVEKTNIYIYGGNLLENHQLSNKEIE
jgi:hypothetical protein